MTCQECGERPAQARGLCSTCRHREYRQRNPDYAKRHRISQQRSSRVNHLRIRYGLTEADYDRLLAEQGGVCAICQQIPPGGVFAVDHDHETGRIRGLLCQRTCNRGLGIFRDDPEVLRRAMDYLLNSTSNQESR